MQTPSLICAQQGSKFLCAPAEIRFAVYEHFIPDRVHVHLRRDRIHLSTCILKPNEYKYHSEIENQFRDLPDLMFRGDVPDPVLARRLRSAWGPHWKCEALAIGLGTDDNPEMGVHTLEILLRVCKKHFDVLSCMRGTAEVSSIETILHQTEMMNAPSAEIPPAFTVVPFSLTSFTKLNLTLKFPLAVCRLLEHAAGEHDLGTTADVSNCVSSQQLNGWLRIAPAILQLKSLTQLRIWIDHDEQDSWSVVNERAIIRPLEPLAEVTGLDVPLDLPKLHPLYEDPERHFTQDSAASPFPIHRRFRQYHFGKLHSDGNLTANYKGDFPISIEFQEFCACNVDPYNEHPGYEDPEFPYNASLEHMEEWERREWKRGAPVEFMVRDVHQLFGGCMTY